MSADLAKFWSKFLIRTRTALMLAPITIILIVIDRIFLMLGVVAIIWLACIEYSRLIHRKEIYPFYLTIFVPAMTVPVFAYLKVHLALALTVSVIFIIVTVIIRSEMENFLERTTTPLFALLYLGFLPSTLIALRGFGIWHALFPILITWVNDTGAYLVGSRIGKYKVAPVLSPQKTWEGVIGGLISTIIAVYLFSNIFQFYLAGWKLIFLGLTIPFVSLVGDLFESGLKREVGLKDTSSILPGHGGVLDRIDSLLFVIPYFYIFYYFFR